MGLRHLLLFLLLLLGTSAHDSDRCLRVTDILGRLSDLVDFYASDPDRINADGYFGLSLSRDRLASGQVQRALLTACPGVASWHLGSIVDRQSRLVDRFSRDIANGGKSRYDVDTFERICQPLTRRLRRLTTAPRMRQQAAVQMFSEFSARRSNLADRVDIVAQLISYDEPLGDQCLLAALRSEDSCPQQESSCRYFERPLKESSGYYLTHQLLYKLAVALTRCPNSESRQSAASDEAFAIPAELTASCGKIFQEFKLIEAANWTKIAEHANGDTVTGLRDLYMEQALLCGLIGANDFYHRVSVNTVASWQDGELGCFKIFGHDEIPSLAGRRRILRDAEMLGGCSSHSSGLAMGFYSNAVRYLLNV